MKDKFKMKKLKLGDLKLSPDFPSEYRSMLLGLAYRSSYFSDVPEQLLIDYIIAHPPVGVIGDDEKFYVTSNIRSLAIKPFLPSDTKILVMVDISSQPNDLMFVSAQREILNCVVPAMERKLYSRAVAALWSVILKGRGTPLVPTKIALAHLAGLRRQSLSEKRAEQPEAKFMKEKGGSK